MLDIPVLLIIIVIVALIGAIAWNLLTWYYGLPSSSSHALIGGLIGAAITHAGFASLNGMSILKKLQILSAAFMATSHGLNDAQKTMGVITLALLLFHQIDSIVIPFWVTLSCASAMALGTALGGWKIIKTMGHRISKLEPTTGFAAETSASLVITGASLIGAPISTTHTITACIFGVGSAKRLSAVRCEMAANLTVAWVTTIPASAAIAAASFFLLKIMGIGG